MIVKHAPFEKRNLGVETYEVTIEQQDDFINFEKELEKIDADYVVVKTPVNKKDFLWGMETLGFTFIEAQLMLYLKKDEFVKPERNRRFEGKISYNIIDKNGDSSKVFTHILSGLYETDRIALDNVFGIKDAAVRYKNWTQDLLDSGGVIVEMLVEGKAVGYFLCPIQSGDDGTAGLTAIYSDSQGKGYGHLLLQQMSEYIFEQGTKTIHTGVSSNNLPIIGIHESIGYKIENILYVYVRHK